MVDRVSVSCHDGALLLGWRDDRACVDATRYGTVLLDFVHHQELYVTFRSGLFIDGSPFLKCEHVLRIRDLAHLLIGKVATWLAILTHLKFVALLVLLPPFGLVVTARLFRNAILDDPLVHARLVSPVAAVVSVSILGLFAGYYGLDSDVHVRKGGFTHNFNAVRNG